MGVLDDSWRFARKFNADKDLRTKLWKAGEFSSAEVDTVVDPEPAAEGCRIHEAITELAQAGIERRRYTHQCPFEDVQGSEGCASRDKDRCTRSACPVSAFLDGCFGEWNEADPSD